MSSRKRRKARAKPPQQAKIAQPVSAPNSKWWQPQRRPSALVILKWVLWSFPLAVILPLCFQYAPSWSLDLPSASFRPNNPFTGVFTITNVGYLPASQVSVQCAQKMIEYSDPPDTYSADLIGEPSTASWMNRNEKLSVICPQVVAGIKIFPRVITPDEAKKLHDQVVAANPFNDNPHVIWADLIFTIKYAPIAMFPVWHWTDTRRVKGEPSENGTFVWMQVPIDRVYDRPSYQQHRTLQKLRPKSN
jgi:hypothetical protein